MTTLASVTNLDLGIWLAMFGGGLCAEYFIGVIRRIKPRD